MRTVAVVVLTAAVAVSTVWAQPSVTVDTSKLSTGSPALASYTKNDLFGRVLQDEKLSVRDRSLVTVAASAQATRMGEFVLIHGGSFTMGSALTEPTRGEDEVQHRVTVSDFLMSRYEVTQEEYQKLMGDNPSGFTGKTLPVENVSWLYAWNPEDPAVFLFAANLAIMGVCAAATYYGQNGLRRSG